MLSKKVKNFNLTLIDQCALFFSTILMIFQFFYNPINVKNLFFAFFDTDALVKVEDDKKNVIISNLKAQLRIEKKKNDEMKKYKSLYDDLNDNFFSIATLNVVYNIKNQYGRNVVAKSNVKIDSNEFVVDKYGYVVGRIVNFSSKYRLASLQLITDTKFRVPAMVANKDFYGLLIGNNEENCFLKMIENVGENSEISDGDIVITSGEEKLTVKGMVLGEVKKYNNEICVKPLANVEHLDKLQVVRKKINGSIIQVDRKNNVVAKEVN